MNLSGLLDIFAPLDVFQQLATQSPPADVHPLHLPRAVRAPLLAALQRTWDRPLLLVIGRVDAVSLWQQALEAWLPPGTPLLRFPEPTPLPYDHAPWSEESRLGRITVLTRLMAGQHPLLPRQSRPPIVLTSARALLQKTIPKHQLLKTLRVLKRGQLIDIDKTLTGWQAVGYEPVSVVEAACQFSQRGGILDIFPASAPYPVRIELFGDEIDTLRFFDPATQRSVQTDVTQVVIPPAREALPAAGPALAERLAADLPPKEDDLPAWQDDLPDLLRGTPFAQLEFYLPLLYSRPGSLLDFLPPETRIVSDDWAELVAAVRDLAGKTIQMRGQQQTLPPGYGSPLFEWDDVATQLTQRGVLVLGDLSEEPLAPPENAPLELADLVQPGPRHGGQERPFLAQLQKGLDLGQRTVVVSRQAERLAEIWRNQRQWGSFELGAGARAGVLRPLEALLDLPAAGTLTFVTGSLADGFMLEDARGNTLLNLISDAEVFGWNRPAPRRRRVQRAVAPETYFSDIEPGDYVVHIEYGVGQFIGMVVRSIGGTEREYLQINYANSDTLYIPVHHADRLSKWIGSEAHQPALHRVGEKRWRQAKASAQQAVNELADELLDLYAARETIAGHAFASDTEWQAEIEASFPYQETEDQLHAIADVKQDMQKTTPMDRLICGDVGFGKTEVALRAAFKAVMDGKQVAILVPTTVLAQQHYNTFRERLTPWPVKLALLSRFQSSREAHTIVHDMREGAVDIVIGTHRLLSDDVSFKDLGLLIIDEEQRFGVTHKEKLKRLRTEVDVLTMTATPIPRTLYMGLSGLRDISIINTPPQERLPVQTYVGQSDEALVKRALLRELDRGGQIYFVHNHIQTIDAVYRQLRTLVPEARIGIGHGQLGEDELEAVMTAFAAHTLDILVCTTIIESGLDIPNANTLIVDRAELFGLSQLYQLRGRVGRGARRAYAYFFHANWNKLTPEARARLETLDEHTDLGSGYSIAMRDLEIRGAGELLGPNQSGHIGAVGFDLYMRMLAQAVRARKAAREGKVVPTDIPDAVTIDLPLPAYIPTDYVPDAALRLRLYRRMAGLETLEAIGDMAAELTDRFGALPDPLDNLLYQLRIKVLAARNGITTIMSEAGQVRLRVDLEEIDRTYLQRYLGEGVRVSKSAIWLTQEIGTHELRVRLVQILERLGRFADERAAALRRAAQ